MVMSTNSGYLAALQAVTFPTNLFDAMAIEEWTDASDEIDNSVSKYEFADIVIDLASAVFPGGNIAIYLIPSVDDSTFGKFSGGGATADEEENEQYYRGSVATGVETAAQTHLVLEGVKLPNGKFKLAVRNMTGVALGASNTIKWRPHGYSSQ